MGKTFTYDTDAVQNYKELLIPEGVYEMQVVKYKATKSKAGNDMIVFDLEITDTYPGGQEIDTEEFRDPYGVTMRYWFTFTKDNFFHKRLKDLLETFGMDISGELDVDEFDSQVGNFRVAYETRDGVKRPKVAGPVVIEED